MNRIFLMIFCLTSFPLLAVGFSGGDGSSGNPFQVEYPEQLDLIREYLDASFIQIADIDLNVSPYNQGKGWTPIGDNDRSFVGQYNGNNYSIYNLMIADSALIKCGLFGSVYGAELFNIDLVNVNIYGNQEIGSTVGRAEGSSIAYCTSTGQIYSSDTMIGSWAGGIAGIITGGTTLEKSCFSGSIYGLSFIGGLIGSAENSTVINSYSEGSITGYSEVGGLIGSCYTSNIYNSYSLSDLEGSYGSGFIGEATDTGIYNSYSAGHIGGIYPLGGFLGSSVHTVCSYCFWDTETSGMTVSGGGTGKTTAEMYDKTTYKAWDLDTPVWKIVDDVIYPYLHWQPYSELAFTVSPSGFGTINGINGQYPKGRNVALTASSNINTVLINWLDLNMQVISDQNDFFYFVTNNDTITAIFDYMYIPITSNIIDVYYGSSCWGDYDNDGDLDLVINGYTSSWFTSKIYRNDGGSFNDINAVLIELAEGSSDWGDYDNDGDLDLVMTGRYGQTLLSLIYRNDNGTFTNLNAGLKGLVKGSSCWGDYDNDGDLDLLITGINSTFIYTETVLYRNDDGVFIETNSGLIGSQDSSADWGDYDNDGDLDLVLSGSDGEFLHSIIYRNDNGVFTDTNSGLPGLFGSFTDWGDYDNDGDLDLILTGSDGLSRISRIYRNDNGIFTDINAGITGVNTGSTSWGDFDNDGDLDLVITGYTGSLRIAKLYKNDFGTFNEINVDFDGVSASFSNWCDYDNDGDLDILIGGYSSEVSSGKTILYENLKNTVNSAPSTPVNLSFSQSQDCLEFSFDPSTDAETPSAGLTYNIEINIGDGIVKPSSSDLTTGYKRIPAMGNIQQNTSWILKKDAPDTVLPQELIPMTWSVQAVDNGYQGSLFSTAADTIQNRDLVTVPKELMSPEDQLIWEYVIPEENVAGYTLQVSSSLSFDFYYEQVLNITKGSKTGYFGIALNELDFFDSLQENTRYHWRVKPEHIYPENITVFKDDPDTFIFNQFLVAPSNISVTVSGQFVTLQWGAEKTEKSEILYKVYSTNDPAAVFPSGWLYETSTTGNYCIIPSASAKRFYCVTANNDAKTEMK
ncbi:MAG TPA: FG-GAP-like repeat-containing protein [Clostridiales bacterium]|nr:FG-GAP-like repeat-containing protein [Clostridiales bacterium]